MKIQIISDCHLEHRAMQAPKYGLSFDKKADVLVVAGDLEHLLSGCHFLKTCEFPRDIIYVPGNHEYYGTIKHEVEDAAIEYCKDSRVRLLLDDTFIKKGVKFIGSTLWTDYNVHKNATHAIRLCYNTMNDHRMIRVGEKEYWSPVDALEQHKMSRQFILDELKKPHDGPVVIVTHHGPSIKSTDLKYRNDPVTAGFVSNMEKMIKHFQPAMWIHGHTHNRIMYTIDKTQVVCYPYGYPGELGLYHPLTLEV